MLILRKPAFEELSFRQALLSDGATMSYNEKWGGAIGFPEERWRSWYERWVQPGNKSRFYRYLCDGDTPVGETAWYYDEVLGGYMMSIIVHHHYRRRGYGREGLGLLIVEASTAGIERLYDEIAFGNPSLKLFLAAGFSEVRRTPEGILVEKEL